MEIGSYILQIYSSNITETIYSNYLNEVVDERWLLLCKFGI